MFVLIYNLSYWGDGKMTTEEEAIAIALNSGINRKEAHSFYKSRGYNAKGYNFSKTLCK